jgi:hypothetical protein
MHDSDGASTEMIRSSEPAARWYGYVFFGYVPPALLAGRTAMNR